MSLPLAAQDGDDAALQEAIRRLDYLTPQALFGTVERGRPLPYTLPPIELAAAGLTRETWRLEVVGDTSAPPRHDRAMLTVANGRAPRFDDLLQFGERHSVRFLKTLTCANGVHPLGTGLWEGIPLRLILNRVGLRSHCRRIYYHGFHNHQPRQIFRASLPLMRVLEDPPHTPPVILAYKLNGEWISGQRGGPVRMIVPESYGFKSVKWLNKIILSNRSTSNDTYAQYNNTTESLMKTLARFVAPPEQAPAGTRIPITGIAQVGSAGLRKVQVWIARGVPEVSDDNRHFYREEWQDAELLPPPEDWSVSDAEHPAGTGDAPRARGFSQSQRAPRHWPLSYATAHWATRTPPLPAGHYTLYCRSVDRDGRPQPWPRTLQNDGRNLLHNVPLEIT